MKMKRFLTFYSGLLLCYFYFLVTGVSFAKQLPEKEKQIDVITLVIPEKKMVDVRKAARNLHNKEMYGEARRALVLSDNAYLSSSTVNLLKTALNDDSAEVRLRAIDLLCYCRNPEAIPLLADRLQNDPSSRVRSLAASVLGKLAGEAAVPLLKAAWTEDKNISRGVIYGLGYAGGTAVPFLIERLKEKIEKNGSAIWLINLLGSTGDRRVIEPFLDIISRPTSASDMQLQAVRVLVDFANMPDYARILEYHAKFSAIDVMRPPESRRVNMADRVQILEFLKKIIESEPEYKVAPKTGWIGMPIGSTGEKPVIQAAYEGVELIERCMALFEQFGPDYWNPWEIILLAEPKEKISSDGKK
jgi:hypothetical protein